MQEQIKQDGVNMQIDNWLSIQQYILMNWNELSDKHDLEQNEKENLAKKAAKKIVKSRGKKNQHPHGLIWEDALEIIKSIV